MINNFAQVEDLNLGTNDIKSEMILFSIRDTNYEVAIKSYSKIDLDMDMLVSKGFTVEQSKYYAMNNFFYDSSKVIPSSSSSSSSSPSPEPPTPSDPDVNSKLVDIVIWGSIFLIIILLMAGLVYLGVKYKKMVKEQ